jgi:hypothetical protein
LLSKSKNVNIYGTVILDVVLYECKTWSLTLKDEHGLRVFQNGVLSNVFGPKRDEVTGRGKKIPKEELHDLYSSANIIQMKK